jgi:hypothetical protein
MLELIKQAWQKLLSKTTIDEKAKEIITEVDKRIEDVKKESKDVVKAAKKVKSELKDVVDAAAGKEVKPKKRKPRAKKK